MNKYCRNDSKTFERVALNALNSVEREELTDEEWDAHCQWVSDNWEELNDGNFEEE
jgi:hypothetical protein